VIRGKLAERRGRAYHDGEGIDVERGWNIGQGGLDKGKKGNKEKKKAGWEGEMTEKKRETLCS